MELGNESNYRENCSKIKSKAPEPVVDGKFEELTDAWIVAVKDLETYQKRPKQEKNEATIEALKMKLKERRLALDSYNRYSISVRGASPDVYGILREAGIVKEFATLLSITMPSPNNQDRTIQHMRPLDRLGVSSNHTPWMSEYVV
jgi:hypothetical protein